MSADSQVPVTQYRAVVTGATGAVGTSLVRELLASRQCSAVTILTRRQADAFDSSPHRAKLRERIIDMDALERETAESASGYDVAFCTMGVGQPRKLSRDEVRKIDVDYAGAFARGARAAGVRHISLLSSVGADRKSPAYYLRLKGEAEHEVVSAGMPRTSLFRPSLLVTKEIRYGLQDRLTQAITPLVTPLLPARFHQIRVEDLGRAMRINAERTGSGTEVLHFPEFAMLLAGS
jgi:uncharacterized protein YbjT (DUF2867 family)